MRVANHNGHKDHKDFHKEPCASLCSLRPSWLKHQAPSAPPRLREKEIRKICEICGQDYFTGDGGSLLVHGEKTNTKLTIRDCRFENVYSYGNGGAISLSKDSSPDGRTYFVVTPGWNWPLPIDSEPIQLGGGCIGLISNVTFTSCNGGWQGGAISANGRGMELQIIDSTFKTCKGGTTHKRDGKGGAIAVCGGLQSSSTPVNNVVIKGGSISGCTASGNGGGIYVTIRGKTTLTGNASIKNCKAENLDNEPMVEGMGGGVHVSAGGYFYLDETSGKCIEISGNTANVSGGGLSAKSGCIIVQGNAAVAVSGNKAEGIAANGYGNGGGIFITTSRHDDFIIDWPPGAGHGAAMVFGEDGFFSSQSSNLSIEDNAAKRWGGGLYAGISPPWYFIASNSGNYNEASVTFNHGSISGNTCETPEKATSSSFMPSQITAECVLGSSAVLDFGDASIIGNATTLTDIGIYLYLSKMPSISYTIFTNFLPDRKVVTEY